MSWGIFKKIAQAVKKAAQWVNNKVIKPVVKFAGSDTGKKLIKAGMNLAPLIGAGVAGAAGAPPQAGMAAGNVVQGVGRAFGLG